MSHAPPVGRLPWPRTLVAATALELRRWSRQKRAMLTMLVLPAAVSVLVVAALGKQPSIDTTWAIVDQDDGPAATSFDDEVLQDPTIAPMVETRWVDLGTARRLVDNGEVGAAIVLPRGVTEDLVAGRQPPIEVLRSSQEPISSDLAALVVEIFTVRAWATSISGPLGGPPASGSPPIEVAVASATGGDLDAPTHYGPAIGMFFVLLGLGFAAHAQVADRQRGIEDRIATAPVPTWAVQLGRAAAGSVIGGLGFAVVAATIAVLFDRTWGPLLPVVALTAAVLVAYTGLAALVASVVRTAGQAQITTTALAFGLAFASGSFSPAGSTSRPPLAALAPSTRALDAFSELAVDGAGVGAIGGALLFLVALGVLAVIASRMVPARST